MQIYRPHLYRPHLSLICPLLEGKERTFFSSFFYNHIQSQRNTLYGSIAFKTNMAAHVTLKWKVKKAKKKKDSHHTGQFQLENKNCWLSCEVEEGEVMKIRLRKKETWFVRGRDIFPYYHTTTDIWLHSEYKARFNNLCSCMQAISSVLCTEDIACVM